MLWSFPIVLEIYNFGDRENQMPWQNNVLITNAAIPKMLEQLKIQFPDVTFIMSSRCNQDALGKFIYLQ